MKTNDYTMSQLIEKLHQLGVKDATDRKIRYFIHKKLMPRPSGTRGGARYDDDHLFRIIAIHKLWKRLRLDEIKRELKGKEPEQIRAFALQEEPERTSGTAREFRDNRDLLRAEVEEDILASPSRTIPGTRIMHDGKFHMYSENIVSLRSPPFSLRQTSDTWQRFNVRDGLELSVRTDAIHDLSSKAEIVADEIRLTLELLADETTSRTADFVPYVSPGVVYQQFECSRIEGHLIAEIGAHRVVIETGFPFSFGDCGTLSICGREFPIPRELNMLASTFSITDYRELIGKGFNALMGADLLDKFDFMIDLRKMKILFASNFENIDGNQVEFQLKDNLPIVSVDLPEGTFPFLIATGNKHSFIDSSIGQHYQAVDKDTDFLPKIGDQPGKEFPTPLRKVKFKLGGKSYSLYFGQYPPHEEETFRSGFGVKGVFGGDFLERRPVIFSWKRKELCLVKNI